MSFNSVQKITTTLEAIAEKASDIDAATLRKIAQELRTTQITILSSINECNLLSQNVVATLDFSYQWAHIDHDNQETDLQKSIATVDSIEKQDSWVDEHLHPSTYNE